MRRISKHISYNEAVKSQTAIRYGIDNTPSEEELANMRLVANNCFEPLRKAFNIPIGISSFYRCEALNKKVKGSKRSQHMTGKAIDIDGDMYGGITNKEIFLWLQHNVDFDQLIWEYGDDKNPAWVHVSYVSEKENRRQVIRIG